MRPITQVRTGYGRGQCTEASLASLLEVELEAVPDLWAGPQVPLEATAEEHQPQEKLNALWHWLRSVHGRVWCELRFPRALSLGELGPETIAGALRSVWPDLPCPELKPWAEHHVMYGPHNPTGFGHCVVGRRGQVVHDPNPARSGISACEGLIFLVPVELVPEGAPLAPCWLLRFEGDT